MPERESAAGDPQAVTLGRLQEKSGFVAIGFIVLKRRLAAKNWGEAVDQAALVVECLFHRRDTKTIFLS